MLDLQKIARVDQEQHLEHGWISSFNTAEDSMLQGLPIEAQLLYLRGLRRSMDPTTSIVGRAGYRISYLGLSSRIEVFPAPGMKGVRPDKSKVRRLAGQLERAGLIERLEEEDGYLVYFLPFACLMDDGEGELV